MKKIKLKRSVFDWLPVPFVEVIIIAVAGAILGDIICVPIEDHIKGIDKEVVNFFFAYFQTIGVWLFAAAYMFAIKKYRPIIKGFKDKDIKGTIKMLLAGFLLGFISNASCVLLAIALKELSISFVSVNVLGLIAFFIAVFVQSSMEEMLCRGFLYQRLLRAYKKPAVAIIGNALLFGILHVLNPGVTPLSIINIILVGIHYSLLVYYFDSIWLPMAAHAAWNFTQNILFGLPNSGSETHFSVYELVSARDGIAYNTNFGVEGTIYTCVLLLLVNVPVIIIGRKYQSSKRNLEST